MANTSGDEVPTPSPEVIHGQIIDDVQSDGHSGSGSSASLSLTLAQYHHSGPLPDPRTLALYDEILPGLADRIMTMADNQSNNRMALEKAVVYGNVAGDSRGMHAAVVVAVAMICLAAFLAYLHMPGYAVTVAITNIAAIAGLFVVAQKQQAKEIAEKRETLRSLPATSGRMGGPPILPDMYQFCLRNGVLRILTGAAFF